RSVRCCQRCLAGSSSCSSSVVASIRWASCSTCGRDCATTTPSGTASFWQVHAVTSRPSSTPSASPAPPDPAPLRPALADEPRRPAQNIGRGAEGREQRDRLRLEDAKARSRLVNPQRGDQGGLPCVFACRFAEPGGFAFPIEQVVGDLEG